MILTKLFKEFFNSEKTAGIILIVATGISLYLANSNFQTEYLGFWAKDIAGHSITHWINDGLMAIFFLMIGLELERELYIGELSSFKNASLPVIAAIGGMLIPAIIYLSFNFGTEMQSGFGIPMATDIAFAIGVLSLLGRKIPAAIKVFLIALAVIDDLGAILVIAIFYSKTISLVALGIAGGIFALLLILNRLQIRNLIPYLIGGVFMWYFILQSGVHASIAGILLAFAIPFGCGGEKSPSYILQHLLHKPVAFIILPIFALANTGIIIEADWYKNILHPASIGIIAGLFIGKPIGIFLFSYLGNRLRICSLPPEIKWRHIFATACLAGIGFTMSIFITFLAYENPVYITKSKIAIILASLLSAITGYILLKTCFKTNVEDNE